MKDAQINILITSVSNKVTLVNSFKDALKHENVIGKVIGLDINPYSAGLYACDAFDVSPRLDDPRFDEYIIETCKKNNISLVVPTRDSDVLYLAKNQKTFDQAGVKVVAPSYETATVCNDKYAFFKFLVRNHFPFIQTWLDKAEVTNFPCIVKERWGAGSRGVQLVSNPEEMDMALKLVSNPLFQEQVVGVEYSVDYFSDWQGKVISIVPRVRLLVEDGESKVGVTVDDKEVLELARAVGEKLQLIGHNVLQCFKLSDGSVKLLEINPRYGGGSSLSFASGANTPVFILRLLRNLPVSYQGFKPGLIMMRFSQDLFLEDAEVSKV